MLDLKLYCVWRRRFAWLFSKSQISEAADYARCYVTMHISSKSILYVLYLRYAVKTAPIDKFASNGSFEKPRTSIACQNAIVFARWNVVANYTAQRRRSVTVWFQRRNWTSIFRSSPIHWTRTVISATLFIEQTVNCCRYQIGVWVMTVY